MDRFLRAGALSLSVEEEPDYSLVLRMKGELDLASVGQLMAALDRVDVDQTAQVVFDLRELAFLDLAGLSMIIRANEHCKDHAIPVTVIKPRGHASRVFTLTRAHRELDLVDLEPGSSGWIRTTDLTIMSGAL